MLVQFHQNLKFFPFSAAQNNKKKLLLHFLPQVSCKLKLHLVFDNIESNFLNTPTGVLKLNHQLVQYNVDPMIQFGLFSRCY